MKNVEKQKNALRQPAQIVTASYAQLGINKQTLSYKADKGFLNVLQQLNTTLLVTREYEHLLLAFSADNKHVHQTFLPLPHPSGLAVAPDQTRVYVAATRNPNKIIELAVTDKRWDRTDNQFPLSESPMLMPTREKYYPGCYYLHDLAFINNSLYATAVGLNSIIGVNFDTPTPDEVVWSPACMRKENGTVHTEANYIQLNSMAAGSSLQRSYFTASTDNISNIRPGDTAFEVDKKGVIFDGQTGEVFALGLTRPHSARFAPDGKLWVCNSGYGQVGYIENGVFISAMQLPGWTRGLCFHQNVLFVGFSLVLPRFRHYAPGLSGNEKCGIVALSYPSLNVLGYLHFPKGNQIFGIECISAHKACSLPFSSTASNTDREQALFYKYG